MSRRFLDDIKTDIASLMADNGTGDFTLAQDRIIRVDTIDSTIDDEAAIYSSTPVAGPIATTIAFSSLTTGLYDTAIGDDSVGGAFLNTDPTNGVIVSKNIAGFHYNIEAGVNFTPSNGVTYDFSIGINGVEGFRTASVTGQPGGDPASISLKRISLSTPLSASFSLMCRTPDGVDSLDIIEAVLIATIKPTNNPA